MIKYFYLLSFFISSFIYGQTSIGFVDNFTGIQSVIYNPANISDSFYNFDINVLSIDLNIISDQTLLNPLYIINNINLNSKYYASGRVLGPSFLYNINRQTTIGLTTGIRSYIHYHGIPDNIFLNDFIESSDFSFNNKDINGNFFAWQEIGFTYAKIITNNSDNIFKVGATLNFLKGISNYGFELNNFNITGATEPINTVSIIGDVDVYSADKNINYGQSINVGFVYEKRNKTLPKYNKSDGVLFYNKAPYQYKLSASITDLGFLNFNNVDNRNISTDITITQDDIFNTDLFHINNALNTISKNYILPTTLHINFDYNLNNHWFINHNVDLFLLSRNRNESIQTVSSLTISPRYESKNFSAFFPFSINNFGVFKSGIGFNIYYFSVGSSSLFTNKSNNYNETDIFIGIKIPFLSKKIFNEFKETFEYYKKD